MKFSCSKLTAATSLMVSIALAGRDASAFTGPALLSQRSSHWALGEQSSSTQDAAPEAAPDADAGKTAADESESSSSSGGGGKSSKGGALVPIPLTEDTIEFTSGLVAGTLGLTVGGPILGAIAAGLANYASKDEAGPGGEIVRAVAKTAVDVYNFLAELDGKYEVTEKGRQSVQNALEWVKGRDDVDAEVVEKIEKAVADTVNGIAEINDEYDFTGAGLSLLDSVGDLVAESVRAMSEMNKEYELSDKAMTNLKDAVEKTKGKE